MQCPGQLGISRWRLRFISVFAGPGVAGSGNHARAAQKPHSIGANRAVAAPLPRKRDSSYAWGYSGGQSPIRLALSLVEIVCVKPAIGNWISATDSKCDSLSFVTANAPLAPVEQSIV